MKIFYGVSLLATPTAQLLKSSAVVAISGGLRLHVAFLLAGLSMNIPVYIAGSLIIYATYTLDRAFDSKEDAINRAELYGSDRKTGFIAVIVTFLIGLSIFASEGIWLAPFFPFIVGYFYTNGIRIGSFTLKLKGGAGIKNIVTGITWGGTIALIVSRWSSGIGIFCVIFLFFGLKTFVTSCVNDFKDIEGDTAAGIRTLPACLGEETTKIVLILILLGIHGFMFYSTVLNIIRNEWIILATGLVILVSFLLVYSPSFEKKSSLVYRKMREVAISWETAIALSLPVLYTGLIQAGHLV
jgi:4-hydroxybenzoate polyprenyltransferase